MITEVSLHVTSNLTDNTLDMKKKEMCISLTDEFCIISL